MTPAPPFSGIIEIWPFGAERGLMATTTSTSALLEKLRLKDVNAGATTGRA